MTIKKMIGAAALMGVMASANAASMSLIYTSGGIGGSDTMVDARMGDVVTFDVVMDFSDAPTIGGGFDIVFDTNGLAFESYELADFGDPGFARAPDVLDGLLESGAFGNFNPLTGPATVGSVSFTVVGMGLFAVDTAATNGIGGPFIADDFISQITPDFNGAAVNSIPVPAAVWFMLSGLGALVGFGRRKAA